MKIGLSLSPTSTPFAPLFFAGNLDEGLSVAARLGYEGVELSLLDSATVDRRQLKSRLEGLGLEVFAIATGQTNVTEGCALFSLDQARRFKAIERMKGHIDLAADLGCRVILGGIRGRAGAHSNGDSRFPPARGMEAIAACVERAGKARVPLVLEPINRYETDIVNTLAEGVELIGKVADSMRLLPDTFHMNIEEASITESIARAGSRVGYVHVADSNRLVPGWGHLDFVAVLAALARAHYDGPLCVEALPRPTDLAAARQAIQHLRSLESAVATSTTERSRGHGEGTQG
jgi:sugar phosphate isomerase/epimerase